MAQCCIAITIMKSLVLALSLVAAVSARPGGSGGYEYSSQPSGGYLPSDGGFNLQSGSIGGNFGIHGGGGGIGHDQRHIFFFAAPDDEAAARLRVYVSPSGQRNTKIIFVKAPSAGAVIPEVIAPPSQSEDKTLVYVLIKKQDRGGAISIPAGATVKQAKPEVYFIKYRNHQDAQAAVSQGLSGQAAGRGLESLGSAQSFISNLGSDIGLGGGFGGGHGDVFGSSILSGTTGGISSGSLGGISSSIGSLGSSGVTGVSGLHGSTGGVGRYADSSDGYHYK